MRQSAVESDATLRSTRIRYDINLSQDEHKQLEDYTLTMPEQ